MKKIKLKVLFIFSILINSAAWGNCSDCNIIVIGMDAVQAKRISALGYLRKTTPVMDQLASEGVLFSQAISPASWTVPAYLSVFSSVYPSEHTMTNRYKKFTATEKVLSNSSKDTPNLQVMAEVFKKAGYRTGGFTGDSGVSAVLGYNKGFEVFKDAVPFGGIDKSSSAALDWLKSLKKKEKFFLFLHGYDSHGQYALPSDYKGKFMKESKKFKGTKEEQATLREAKIQGKPLNLDDNDKEFWSSWYDSKIYDADQRLGQFLEAYKAMPQATKTVFVLISDHGSEVFEHNGIDHGHTLYDELIMVPFIWKGPDIAKNHIVTEQVSTMDMLPTLLDYTGIKASKSLKSQMKGRSLIKAIFGKPIDAADVYSETDYRNLVHKRTLRTKDGWKYIMTLDDGSEELYNLKNDPKELTNLVSTNKEKAKSLMQILDKHLLAMGQNSKLVNKECLPVYPGQCVQ